jgi:hypothetical protein
MFRPICAIISLSWTHSVKARGGRGSRQPQTTRPLPLIPRVADTVSSERVAPSACTRPAPIGARKQRRFCIRC